MDTWCSELHTAPLKRRRVSDPYRDRGVLRPVSKAHICQQCSHHPPGVPVLLVLRQPLTRFYQHPTILEI